CRTIYNCERVTAPAEPKGAPLPAARNRSTTDPEDRESSSHPLPTCTLSAGPNNTGNPLTCTGVSSASDLPVVRHSIPMAVRAGFGHGVCELSPETTQCVVRSIQPDWPWTRPNS